MRYLLDTNVASDLVRNHGAAWPNASARETKMGSPRLMARLEAVLGALDVIPFEMPADAVHGLIRTRLEQAGRPIGGNDLLIAAQAIALGDTMVTDNEGGIRPHRRPCSGELATPGMTILSSRPSYPEMVGSSPKLPAVGWNTP